MGYVKPPATILSFPKERITREVPLTKLALARYWGVSTRWIERRMAEGLPHSHDRQGRATFMLSEVEPWERARQEEEAS